MTRAITALLMAGALLLGCGKKEDAGGDTTTASGEAIGVKECDDYFTKVQACIGKMSAEAKPAMESAMKTNREAWREAAKKAASQDSLKGGCKAALDAFTTANPACN